jgi:hypothetical protein
MMIKNIYAHTVRLTYIHIPIYFFAERAEIPKLESGACDSRLYVIDKKSNACLYFETMSAMVFTCVELCQSNGSCFNYSDIRRHDTGKQQRGMLPIAYTGELPVSFVTVSLILSRKTVIYSGVLCRASPSVTCTDLITRFN